MREGQKNSITLESLLGLLWTFSAFGGNITLLHSTSVQFQLCINIILTIANCHLTNVLIGFNLIYYLKFQSNVTGEHTCMVLKPLNNDDIESSASDKLGFFSPYYQGLFNFPLLVSLEG